MRVAIRPRREFGVQREQPCPAVGALETFASGGVKVGAFAGDGGGRDPVFQQSPAAGGKVTGGKMS